jgi:hypothetical protein
MDYAKVTQTLVSLMTIPEQWVISFNRTEWKFGDCMCNTLMLEIVHESLAFALIQSLLGKQGNSNSDEQKICLGWKST